MNHLIFIAVLTACFGIGGYQPGSEFFGPFPDGLGHNPHYGPGQLNSSQTGPWPPLVSPHSPLSIAMSFGRYNIHANVFRWLMTVYPIVTALTGFQFSNLLPYILQVVLPLCQPREDYPDHLDPDWPNLYNTEYRTKGKDHSTHQLIHDTLIVWWPNLKQDIIDVLKKCTVCEKYASTKASQPTVNPVPDPEPFKVWELEVVGPFP
ncbi:hypothetical protein DSO57_1019405 [Entomophthora muscae]|uniref:Uncharacterized protein n=1 Tax=Entomophthora muscae TaxID=34485 RepID=A0ACC2UE26_9FUNG|nr:hypothetical protein DSO57_1019405 [Entomophthora muscae]